MRELDVLLTAFIDAAYATLDGDMRDAFDALLEKPDVELNELFTGRAHADDPRIAALVTTIRRLPHA